MKRITLTIPIIFFITIIGGWGEDRKEGNNNQLNGVEYSPSFIDDLQSNKFYKNNI